MGNNTYLQFTLATLFFVGVVMATSSVGVSGNFVNKTKEIHIVAMVPFMFNDRFGYRNAINMATELINNRSDILKDHKIKIHFGETFAQASIALNSFYHHIYTPPVKIAVLGPAYSRATEPVTEATTINALTQVTYAALIPKLVDKAKYPYFFRSTPSMISFNKAKVGLLKTFGWKRVGIIYDYTQTLFFQTVDTIQKEFKKEKIKVLSIEGFSSDFGQTPQHQMQKLKKLDARIILGEFSTNGARRVFCEAYKNKMYGRKYVWIILGALSRDWYKDTRFYNACTPAQLLKASEGYFVVTRLDFRTDGKPSISGLTSQQFYTDLKNRTSNAKKYASFAFDAVWILALAFDKASKTMDLEKFKYKGYSQARKISQALQSVNFESISGPLQFSNVGERLGGVRIQQLRKGVNIDVAEYMLYHENNTLKGNMKFYDGQREKLWNGAPPPLDHAVIQKIPIQFPVSLLAVMWTLSLVGAVISIFFLYVNVCYSSNRLIKMSSPHINNIIIVGCLICYVTVILLGIDTQLIDKSKFPQLCNASAWTLTIGFTLSFGALFSKTWRVYKIFTAARSMERVAILDWHLYGIVLLLLVVDVVILSVWMIIAPFHLDITEASTQEDLANDVLKVFQLYKCSSKQEVPFTSVIYAYKGILLLFGLFLAWETRHVEVPALNDSKFIGMSVYNVGALSAVGIICMYALSGTASIKERYTIVSMCINLCTTVTLCLVFVPKIRLLFSKSNPEDLSRLSGNAGQSLARKSRSFSTDKAPNLSANGYKGSSNGSYKPAFSRTMSDNYAERTSQTGVFEPRNVRAWSSTTEVSYQEDVVPNSVPLKPATSESTILEAEETEGDSSSDCKDSDRDSLNRSVKDIKLHDRDSGTGSSGDSSKRESIINTVPTVDEESAEEAQESCPSSYTDAVKPLSNGDAGIHLNTAL